MKDSTLSIRGLTGRLELLIATIFKKNCFHSSTEVKILLTSQIIIAQSDEDNVKLSKYITDRILVIFFQWDSFSKNFSTKMLVTLELLELRINAAHI